MAIVNLDQLVDGLANTASPPRWFAKSTGPGQTVGRWYSHWADFGPTPAGTYDTTLAGVAVSSGGVPYLSAASGKQGYLGALQWTANSTGYQHVIADRLWHNGGFSATSTSAQTVNSAAFAARDANGSTNGLGVMIGVEVSAVMGASSPSTISVSYTNSSGTSGRTASLEDTQGLTSAPAGGFFRLKLQAGDQGVRSVQSLTLGATWTSGTFNMVAYRILTPVMASNYVGRSYGPMALGLPRLYDGTSAYIMTIPMAATGITFQSCMMITPQA